MNTLLMTFLVGEWLHEQSSGRLVPWPGISFGISTSLRDLGPGQLRGGLELGARASWQNSALLDWKQVDIRPVLLVQYRVSSGVVHGDMGLGFGADIQGTNWKEPDYGWGVAVSPGGRFVSGLELGRSVRFRAQTGVFVGLNGLDLDVLLGVSW